MKNLFFILIAVFLFWVSGISTQAQTTNSDSICVATGYVLSLSVNSVSCANTTTGSATVASTGCVCMFSGCLYTWSNGQTTHTATNLPAGTYGVTVTHPNGCILDTSLVITEPVPFVADVISSDAVCNGMNNGTATVVPSETAGTLSYAWSTGDTLATVDNLAAGTYQVSVTNFINCQTVLPVNISEPPALSIGVATTPTCANAANGGIVPMAVGGTPPYSYACAQMGSTQLLEETDQLAAGTYSLTVTDANSCMSMANATINSLSAPQVALTSPDLNICVGESTQIIASVPGGGASFTWMPTGGLSSATTNAPIASPTTTTTYTVTAHFANGCMSMATITVGVDVCNGTEAIERTEPVLHVATNIADQELLLQWTANNDNAAGRVNLYNLMGQELQSLLIDNNSNKNSAIIDMKGLQKGIYLISFIPNNSNKPVNIKVAYF